jgi:fatty acid desaturase
MKEAIEKLDGKKSHDEAEALYYYHMDRVRDFQHERLIHLLVTFFFSGLLLLSIVGLLWVSSTTLTSVLTLTLLFGGAGLILFVTVLFYVRYYYQLENGVQRLYTLTDQLRQLIL